ncbi:MAG: hypothetical protein C4308_08095 [Chitinophagaceae bacterium]
MRMLAYCFAVTLLFTACQKEISDEVTGGGNAGDYQPVSANSEWNYHSTSQGDYTVKAVGTDTMINGLRYYSFDNINAGITQRFYVSKERGVYHEYTFFPPAATKLDIVVLKDSAVGTSWINTLNRGGVFSYHKYTILAKGQQRTVNGKTFNDVIEVDYEMSIDDPFGGNTPLKLGTGKNYWAKNVGAIESFYNISFLGMPLVTDTTKLVSYTIR